MQRIISQIYRRLFGKQGVISKRPRLALFIILAALVVIVYWQFIIAPSYYGITSDIVSYVDPHNLSFKETLLSYKQMPFWNMYNLSGMPYWADLQLPVFGIITPFLMIVKDVPLATRLVVLIHVLLSGLFMFMCMQALKADLFASFLPALGYMLGGFMVSRIGAGHQNFIYGYPWIPFVVYCYLLSIERKGRLWAYAVLGGLGMALQILAGSGISAIYTYFIVGVMAIILGINSLVSERNFKVFISRYILAAVILGIAAFLIAAIKILPSLEYLPYVARLKGATYETVSAASFLSLTNFISAFTLLDVSKYNFLRVQPWFEYCVYIGWVLFLLGLSALAFFKDRRVVVFGALLIISVLFSMGPHAFGLDFYKILYQKIFIFRYMHIPARFVLVAYFSLLVLSGIGATYLVSLFNKKGIVFTTILKFVIILAVIFELLVFDYRNLKGLLTETIWDSSPSRLGGQPNDWFAAKAAADGMTSFRVFASPVYLMLFTGMKGHFQMSSGLDSMPIKYYPTDDSTSTNKLEVTTELLRFLGVMNTRYVMLGDPVKNKYLARVADSPQDKYVYENLLWYPRAFLAKKAVLIVGKDLQDIYYAKTIQSFLGFDNHNLRENSIFSTALKLDDFPLADLKTYDHIILIKFGTADSQNILGYKQQLAKLGKLIELPSENSKAELIKCLKKYIPINERVVNFGRTDNRVVIRTYSPNKIILHVKSDKGNSFLVLNEVYFPGWSATMDGIKTPILMANGIARGIAIEYAGFHQIIFDYTPLGYREGKRLTIFGIILLIIAFLVILKRRKN